MSTALAERPVTAVAAPAVTNEQLDLIRRTIAKDATPDELRLYLYDCERQGVHPLDKLIHFTKRAGKYTPVTSIDFMRIRAAETGEMAGSDRAVFEGAIGSGEFVARVTVYRLTQGQRFAYEGEAYWSEYKPDQDFMWRKMPHTMLSKCAEAVALRKGFPRQLAGLYAKEELDQADNTAVMSAAPPSGVGEREKPSVPNGAASGTLDTITGEELPPSYHYVRGYSFRNGWHEANLLNYDAQGGALKVSTKKAIGAKLGDAEAENVPVTVTTSAKKNSVGEAYLDTISLLPTALTDAELDAEAARQESARLAGEVL